MNVGIIVSDNQKLGGVYQQEAAVIESLNKYASGQGHTFYIFSSNPITCKGDCDHIKLIMVPSPDPLTRSINFLLDKLLLHRFIRTPIHKAVKNQNIDLMYYLGQDRYCLSIDLPYILTVWDLQHRTQPIFPEVSHNGVWRDRERFFQEAIGKSSAIIVDAESGRDDVENIYRIEKDRIYVMPYILRPDRLSPESDPDVCAKYNLIPNYLFYPAQFWPHKNHISIVKSIKFIKDNYNISLNVVFCGSDKGNLSYVKEAIKKCGLEKQFRFLGFVPDEEIPALYKNALALVMPTYFGPTNIPVYEAFVYGCPVISSNIKGIRDQVGDAGLLVDPGDFKALAEAIMSLYSDEHLRATLIKKGTEKSLEWSGEKYVEQLIKIINKISVVKECWK